MGPAASLPEVRLGGESWLWGGGCAGGAGASQGIGPGAGGQGLVAEGRPEALARLPEALAGKGGVAPVAIKDLSKAHGGCFPLLHLFSLHALPTGGVVSLGEGGDGWARWPQGHGTAPALS